MMTLNRDALLAAARCPTEKVEVPELGGAVQLRGMTARELLSFQRSIEKGQKNGVSAVDQETFPAKLLVRCIVDDEGQRILGDEDWNAVLEWPGALMQRLSTVAFRLCGYGTDQGNS